MVRRYQSNSSNLKNITIGILVLIVLGFCYYNFSYLLVKKEVAPGIATATPKVVINKTKEPVVNSKVNDALDIAAMTFEVVGTKDHPASGELRVLPVRGIITIQFENLKFTSASDLHIYLSKDLTDADFIDLGPIKGSKGTLSYTVPDTASPEYRFVLTWSTKLHTLFNYVEIPQNPI